MAGRRHLRGGERRPPAALLRPLHVPLPKRARSHGSRPELHLRRPQRPLPHHAGPRRAVPDRVRLLRPAGGERGHQAGRPPPGVHRRPHRRAHGQPDPPGGGLRLAPPGPQPRPRLHPLDPVDLPAPAGGRPRLPQAGARQLVPRLPDGAGQRAGAGRRHVRALGRPRRQARPGAVVLPHHPVRRPAARRPRLARLAGAGQGHAAQLDRPLRGGRVRPHGRRPIRQRDRHPGLHHPARHQLRHDLRGARPRAPAGPRPDHRRPAGGGGGVRGPGEHRVRHRPPVHRGAVGEAGRVHRLLRHQPVQRRAGARLPGRLRAHRLRHRRHHGRPRRGPAGLGLRQGLRPAHHPHRPAARRAGTARPTRATA